MLTYAEIHYKPLNLTGLVYRKQPEIIFDTPSRVEPAKPVPVFLIVKDADRFPISVEKVVLNLNYSGKYEKIAVFPYNSEIIDSNIWWDCFNIIPEHSGILLIEPEIYYTCGGKKLVAYKDNYRSLLHIPLAVNVSDESLPHTNGWYGGDIHCHTFFTNDPVEFGAPLEVTAFAAFCMGLDWISATDHSYDLDDMPDEYYHNDPNIIKWFTMREKSKLLRNSITIIPGEEVSCKTKNGRNCHLLSLDSDKFIYGSGDSGERIFHNKSEKFIGEAVSSCIEWGGFACAAHPLEKATIAEKILLGRGKWSESDLDIPGLHAMQFYNGCIDKGFRDGMEMWIKILLNGKRIYAFGGNDSHGDMNSTRSMGIPFMTVKESSEHILGKVLTFVKAESAILEHIVEGLKKGEAIVTDGPFIDLRVETGNYTAIPGREIRTEKAFLAADFKSSIEFGSLKEIKITGGLKKEKNEKILLMEKPENKIYNKSITKNVDCKNFLYIRAECKTTEGRLCFTNPIWVV